MFLPKILLALLCATSQGPGDGIEVRAGDAAVPGQVLAEVRELCLQGLQRLGPTFPGASGRIAVVVHSSGEALSPELARVHLPGSPGLALLQRGEIHLMLRETAQSAGSGLRGVIDHELVHILLHRYAGACAGGLPRWLHEGLAQALAGDTYLGAREEDILWRVRTNSLLRWSDLRDGFPRSADRLREAYGQSYSFVSFLLRELGLETILKAARTCPDGISFTRALVRTTGISMLTLDEQWRDYLVRDSGAVFRILLNNCFSYLLILAVPILALAVIRRLRSDRAAANRMARKEAIEGQDGGPGAGEPR